MKNLITVTVCVLLLTTTSSSCAANIVPIPTSPSPNLPQGHAVSDKPTVTIRNIRFKVEIADTPEKRSLGLANRESLKEGWGMLFVFDEPTLPIFWMKGLRFPIDIVWISPENRLSGITHAAQPEPGIPNSELSLYHPPGLVSYVLELESGTAKRHSFTVGDMVGIISQAQ